MNDEIFYKSLGCYVYLLEDPTNGEIFYVGKGSNDRPLDHFAEKSDHSKVKRIAAIKAVCKEGPRINVLRHHLNADEALLVESATINLLRRQGIKLTNEVAGHHSAEYGLATWDDLRSRYAQPPADISEPAVMVRINQRWKDGMSDKDLYDSTRGWWSIKPLGRKPQPRLAFAVAWGIIREVYEIEKWEDAAPIKSRDDWDESLVGRVQFVGKPATDQIRERYRNKIVTFKQGSANPATYVNC
jgi:hypothetical protein